MAFVAYGVTEKIEELDEVKNYVEIYFNNATKGYFDLKVVDTKILAKNDLPFSDLSKTYNKEYFNVEKVVYFVDFSDIGVNGKADGDNGFYVAWNTPKWTADVTLHEFGHIGFPISTGDIKGKWYPLGAKDDEQYAYVNIVPLLNVNDLMSYARNRNLIEKNHYGDEFLKEILNWYLQKGIYDGPVPALCE